MSAVTVVTLLLLDESIEDGACLSGTYVFDGHGLHPGSLLLAVARDFLDTEETPTEGVSDADMIIWWERDCEDQYYMDILETMTMTPLSAEYVEKLGMEAL